MDRLVQYLVYKKNPLRQLGLVGLKSLHLEANPNQHKMILEKIHARFGPDFNLNNTQRTLAQFLCQESLYSNLFQKMASKILFAGVVPILFLVIIAKSFKSYPRTKSKVFVYRYGDLGYLNSDFQDSEIQAIPTDRSTGNNLSWFDIKFFFKLLK